MGRAILFAAAVIGLGFPLGLGLAVYMASGSTLAPTPASSRVPTGSIAESSLPPLAGTTATTEDISGNCDEAEHRLDPECLPGDTLDGATTDESTTDDTTTTETEDHSGHGGGGDDDSGHGRNHGRGGDD